MPRAHIDLSGLFSYLNANKTLAPNPAYGASSPGQVDYTYSGMPEDAMAKYGTSNPVVRPSMLEAYSNPQLMGDFNKFAYAPAEAAQQEALAQQYFQPQLARQQQALQATRESGAAFADTRFPTETNQAVTRQTALGEAGFQQNLRHIPDLTRVKSEAELAAQKAARDVKNQEAISHWAQARTTGMLPATHSSLSDAQLAALYPDGADFAKLASESESAAGNVYGTPQTIASNQNTIARGLASRLPFMNETELAQAKYNAGMSGSRLDNLGVNQSTQRFTDYANNIIAQGMGLTPAQRLEQPISDTVTDDGRVVTTRSPFMSEKNLQSLMIEKMGGSLLGNQSKVVDSSGKPVAIQPPPKPIQTTIVRGLASPVTPSQVSTNFTNGKPVGAQINSPAPNPTKQPETNPFSNIRQSDITNFGPSFVQERNTRIQELTNQIAEYYKRYPAYAKYGTAPGEKELRQLLAK